MSSRRAKRDVGCHRGVGWYGYENDVCIVAGAVVAFWLRADRILDRECWIGHQSTCVGTLSNGYI